MNPVDVFFNRVAEAGGIRMRAEPPQPLRDRVVELEELVGDYPAMHALDPAWSDFLLEYGGATIESDHGTLCMLGFDERVCFHLRHSDGAVIDDSGLLDFAVLSLEWLERPPEDRYVDIGFSFNTRDERAVGIYLRRGDERPMWFAESFERWLLALADSAEDWSVLDPRSAGRAS